MEQRGTEDMNQQDHTHRRLKPPENTLQPQLHRPQQPPPQQQQQPPPPQQPQKCPRCESINTKFCYYNNYSLSQPRYFCKTCRRYWTQGGTLRNVPVGGGCRKGKRAKPSPSSSSGENISRSLPPVVVQSAQGHSLNVLPMTLGNNLGLPPVNLTATPNYFSGGGFLSSLAAMQSLNRPQGFNQQVNNTGGGATNLGLLQGLNFQSFRPQIQQESEIYQMGNRDKNIEEGVVLYPSHHQNFVQPNRPLGSWTQSFINNNTNVSAAPSSSTLWNNTHSTSGSSMNPNQWPHDLP